MVALDSFYPMTGVTEQLAQWQKFAPYYFGDGVVQGSLNAFSVAQHAPPGMSVDVATGRCFIQGVFGENGSTKQLTIAAADATNPRIDRVVLRCDTVAQDLEVLVLTGVAAVSPAAPALVRSATQTDYSLYQVLVGTTVTSIVTANLTDERQYASPRGIPSRASLAAATTLEPYGPNPLTEGQLLVTVTGTTTISNIAVTNAPAGGGAILVLSFVNAGCTVAVGGNLQLIRNFVSGGAGAVLWLGWTGSAWEELGRSGEQAPAHKYYGNPTGTVAAATFASIVAPDLPSYAGVTMGSLTQGVGVAYTQTSARASQLGKQYQLSAQLAVTGNGTLSAAAVTLVMPSGVQFNAALTAGSPIGIFRIDQASSYTGVLVVSTTASLLAFQMALSPATFWGATPNVSLNSSTTIFININAEVV